MYVVYFFSDKCNEIGATLQWLWGSELLFKSLRLLLHPSGKWIWCPLRWRPNGRDGVSNHQPHDSFLNRLFRHRSKKHQNSASLAFVRGIHRWLVNSPHKWPVTRKMFPFDDVIMYIYRWCLCHTCAFMWCYTPIAVRNANSFPLWSVMVCLAKYYAAQHGWFYLS